MRKSLGADYEGFKRLEEIVDRLSKKDSYLLEPAEYLLLCKAKELSDAYCLKYSPTQPRVPAGSSDGGQWTDGGGGSGTLNKPQPLGRRLWQETFGSKPAAAGELPEPVGYNGPFKPMKVDAATNSVIKNVFDPNDFPHGRGRCASHVRQALNVAGLDVVPPPARPGNKLADARDYGKPLEKVGFVPVMTAGSGTNGSSSSYEPRKGDVVVIQATTRNSSGHMAIYTGEKEGWVSDWVQGDKFWPGPAYREQKPGYVIYRHPNQQ